MDPIDTCDKNLFEFLIDEENQTYFLMNDIAVIILRNGKERDVRLLDPLSAGKYQNLETTDETIKFTYENLTIEIKFPDENIKDIVLKSDSFGSIISCFKAATTRSSSRTLDIEPSTANLTKKSSWNPFKGFRKGGRKSKKYKKLKKYKKSRKFK